MADFYQTGVVTTLHRLKVNDVSRLEGELQRFSEKYCHWTGPTGSVLRV